MKNNKISIDKASPMPLYYQIKEYILNKIKSGELPPGSRIPTEDYYSKYFDVSRITVRKAIQELIHEGFLDRERGKSPTVPQPKMNRVYHQLTGLNDEILNHNSKPSTRVISLYTIPADTRISNLLKCREGIPIVYLCRVRYSDGIPLAYQVSWLVKDLCGYLDNQLIESGSLYNLLQSRGIFLSYAIQNVSAKLPSQLESSLLDIKQATPCLFVERTTYLKGNVPIEYNESLYVGSKYSINMSLYA